MASIPIIHFIQDPPFAVDFRQFTPKRPSLFVRIDFIAKKLIKDVIFCVIEFRNGVIKMYKKIYNKWRMGLPLFQIIIKVIYTAFLCFTFLPFVVFPLMVIMKQIEPIWSYHLEKGVRIEHIRTKEIKLDASKVPSDINIRQLVEIYEDINFHGKLAPGFIASSSRSDGGTECSIDSLKDSLNKFIHNVENRVPLTGTPKAGETSRLKAFYQQIEDAVRLCIHKTNSTILEFEKQNGNDPSKYSANVMGKYDQLLQDRSLLAIHLAIAGLHCGGRYMGEAMERYYYFYGDKLNPGRTLEGDLVELLALHRRAIAQDQIVRYLGDNVHAYAAYMESLGSVLAIPGTQGVTEHMRQKLESARYLELFFKEYNVKEIIRKIQEEIKSSSSLQGKISDWLRDEIGDWKKIDNKVAAEIKEKIESIFLLPVKKCPQAEHLDLLTQLIAFLKKENELIQLENNQVELIIEENEEGIKKVYDLNENGKQLINDLFEQESVKQFLRHHEGSNLNEIIILDDFNAMAKRDDFKKFLLEGLEYSTLAVEINTIIFNGNYDKKKVIEHFSLLNKAGEAVSLLRKNYRIYTIEPTMILRNRQEEQKKTENFSLLSKIKQAISLPWKKYTLSTDKDKLEELIYNHLEFDRKEAFIGEFALENIAKEGISPALMEWLLVSHNILLPQLEVNRFKVFPQNHLFADFFNHVMKVYKEIQVKNNKIDQDLFNEKLETFLWKIAEADLEGLENAAKELMQICGIKEKVRARYTFSRSPKTDAVMQSIINKCFKNKADTLIAAAHQGIDVKNRSFYADTRKVIWMHMTKAMTHLFTKNVFRIAAIITVLAEMYISYLAFFYYAVRTLIVLACFALVTIMGQLIIVNCRQKIRSYFDRISQRVKRESIDKPLIFGMWKEITNRVRDKEWMWN